MASATTLSAHLATPSAANTINAYNSAHLALSGHHLPNNVSPNASPTSFGMETSASLTALPTQYGMAINVCLIALLTLYGMAANV